MSSDYTTFVPNADLLEMMVVMGIDTETAKIALYKTGNQSCDAAIAYVFDNPLSEPEADIPQVHVSSKPSPATSSLEKRRQARDQQRTRENDVEADISQPYKMVFIVNTHLEMGVGKTAAQVAHGALGLYRALREDETANNDALEYWEDDGERKIVLRGQHERHLLDLKESASNAGLLTYLVQDAGLTEVVAGATTVLAIFGQHDHVNTITGELNLL